MEISTHIWTLRRLISEYDRRGGANTTVDDAHESLDAILIAMAAAGLIGGEIDREKDLIDPPAPTTEEVEPWTLALVFNEHGGVSTVSTTELGREESARIYAAWLILRPGAMALIEDKSLTPANLERLVMARASELREMNVGAVEIREPMDDGGVHVITVDLALRGSDPRATR